MITIRMECNTVDWTTMSVIMLNQFAVSGVP
jgi:hypothetical protein